MICNLIPQTELVSEGVLADLKASKRLHSFRRLVFTQKYQYFVRRMHICENYVAVAAKRRSPILKML